MAAAAVGEVSFIAAPLYAGIFGLLEQTVFRGKGLAIIQQGKTCFGNRIDLPEYNLSHPLQYIQRFFLRKFMLTRCSINFPQTDVQRALRL